MQRDGDHSVQADRVHDERLAQPISRRTSHVAERLRRGSSATYAGVRSIRSLETSIRRARDGDERTDGSPPQGSAFRLFFSGRVNTGFIRVLMGSEHFGGAKLHITVAGGIHDSPAATLATRTTLARSRRHPFARPPPPHPIAPTFTRRSEQPGTDTNVGRASGTIQPGLDRNRTASGPTLGRRLAGAGSGTQTYQDMVKITGVSSGFYNHAVTALQTAWP